MVLPGWKNKNSEKALKWVERQPENAPALMKAAELSTDAKVREAAVARITDEALLLRLVKAYCYEAVSALSDTETLYALAASPTFWGGQDRDISYRYDLLMKDPDLSRVMEEWAVSLDLPKANERLKDIRRREKQYGFALLAFRELREKGSDVQIEGLLCSRYDRVRARAMDEALRRHPERAGAYADDDKLHLEERVAAIKTITDPEQRTRYCDRFHTHKWESVSFERSECGDHLDTDEVLRCVFCGKEETRSSRRRL